VPVNHGDWIAQRADGRPLDPSYSRHDPGPVEALPVQRERPPRWATPQEALAAAKEFVANMADHEWIDLVSFHRDWPGGDHRYEPFWSVEIRTMRIFQLGGGRFLPRNAYWRTTGMNYVQHAYDEAVERYSKIDGKDWAHA
jgi:hypothetical protein